MAEENEDAKLHFLDYWRVIRSRKEIILAVVLLVTLTGVAYTLALPKTYRASARIEVREDMPDMDIFGENRGGVTYNLIWLRTQYQKIQSRPVLNEVIKALALQQKWGEKINNGQPLSMEDAGLILSKCLRVEQFRDTTLIDIQAYREDPDEARDIANQIALVFRDQRLANERTRNSRSMESLNNEVQKQQEKVEQADAEVDRKRKEGKVSVMGKGVLFSKQILLDLEAQRITARIDMLTKKARWEKVENLTGDEVIYQSATFIVDTTLQALRQQLMNDEVQLKQLQQNYGENHPEVKQMHAAVDELQEKLAKALDGVKKGIKADYEVANTKYEGIEEEFNQAKEAERTSVSEELHPLEKAERDAQEQRDMLAGLRAKAMQHNIEREAPRTPVEIIEVAERPSRPVSPNVMLNILLSLFLGIGAGVGLAYFIEYLDTSVKTVDDVERYLGLPVLDDRAIR